MMGFLEAARLFQDCWHLYRKYFGKDMGQKEWDGFVETTDELYQKYNKAEFAKDILLAVEKEVEKMQKNGKLGTPS